MFDCAQELAAKRVKHGDYSDESQIILLEDTF